MIRFLKHFSMLNMLNSTEQYECKEKTTKKEIQTQKTGKQTKTQMHHEQNISTYSHAKKPRA